MPVAKRGRAKLGKSKPRARKRRTPPRAKPPAKRAATKHAPRRAKAPERSAAPNRKAPEAELRSLRRARARLERQLTELVQEIGILRQYELRVRALETQLESRDREIVVLRGELQERARAVGLTAAHTEAESQGRLGF